VLVLTSDTAEFVTGLSKPVDGKPDLAGLYRETAAKATLSPKAVFLFSTPPYPLSGADQVRILNEASGRLPIFGSVSICLPAKDEDTSLYYNGEFCSDGLALIILCGKFKASFAYLTTPIRKHLLKGIMITKAEKNILKELNKTAAAQFLKEAGIIHEAIDGLSLLTMPLCVENSFHSGYIRIMHFINNDGSIYCHSDLEEGQTASIGIIEHRDIIDSALKFSDDFAAKNGSAIIFSCGVRSIALGLNYDSEVSIISEKANSDYLFAYSGGEYCPSPSGDNNFLTACIAACRFE
jgi:hypothetical protein